MARPFTIIDGYNLMHAVGLARKKYGPGGLERCRTQFLRYLLSRINPDELERTTVVFDAADAPSDLPRRTMLQGMEILFAKRGGDADSLIEELIEKHPAPRQVRVISGDRRLQFAARRRRGSFVESEDFAQELARRSTFTDTPSAKSTSQLPPEKLVGPLSEEATNAWLKEFGDIPEAGQLARPEHGRLQASVDEIVKNETRADNEGTAGKRKGV